MSMNLLLGVGWHKRMGFRVRGLGLSSVKRKAKLVQCWTGGCRSMGVLVGRATAPWGWGAFFHPPGYEQDASDKEAMWLPLSPPESRSGGLIPSYRRSSTSERAVMKNSEQS